jgi:hypothetical protein
VRGTRPSWEAAAHHSLAERCPAEIPALSVHPRFGRLGVFLALGLVLSPRQGSGQFPQSSPPSANAEEPRPVPELDKLSFLVGDWAHSEIYHLGPQGPGGPGAGRSKAAWLLGSHFIYILYATRGPWGYREARAFLSWDGGAYRLDWFDDQGRVRRFSGTSPKAGELDLTGELSVNGQPAEERVLVRRREDGKVLLTIEISLPHRKPDSLMEAVLSKVPSSD